MRECVSVCVCRMTVCRASALDLCPCSAHSHSQRRPLPGGPALPRAPRLAGVSLWYDADTLVCQGRGGGPRSSHHLCNAKRKMATGPQSCGRGWRGTPLPGISTTATGERETGQGASQLGGPGSRRQAGRLWEDLLLSSSLWGPEGRHGLQCTQTHSAWT